MNSDNEFALVPARLLLRTIMSCPKGNIRWMNGIWQNQVSGIATTLLRQLSKFYSLFAFIWAKLASFSVLP